MFAEVHLMVGIMIIRRLQIQVATVGPYELEFNYNSNNMNGSICEYLSGSPT